MNEIQYIEKDKAGLDLIASLWWKLRQHHKVRAPEYFAGQFEKMPFDFRKKLLLAKVKNGGAVHIDLAQDRNTNDLIGYCISSVTNKKQGEIESIYIEEKYRKRGIGDVFMKKALCWLKNQAVNRVIIGVAVGNEEVFSFYHHYGFYPRTTILEQVDTK